MSEPLTEEQWEAVLPKIKPGDRIVFRDFGAPVGTEYEAPSRWGDLVSAWFHRHAGWVLPVLFGLLLVGGFAGMWVQGDLIWAVTP